MTLTLRDKVDIVSFRPTEPVNTRQTQGRHQRHGECLELMLLENGREDERQCGQHRKMLPSIPVEKSTIYTFI